MSKIGNKVLVVIPHSGIMCPPEIATETLSDCQQELANNNVDWFTNHLYSFCDLLDNREVVFPYNQIYINVNRLPNDLDESVPLIIDNTPIYRKDPTTQLRSELIRKYHDGFHSAIHTCDKAFILDGHSTVTGHTDASGDEVRDDIIISDFQQSKYDPIGGTRTAPDGYLHTYAEQLDKRLSRLNIKVAENTTYCSTYGHTMARHGWEGNGNVGSKAPLILQETNERLYVSNGIPDVKMIEELRRIFAESIMAMLSTMLK